jgi:hydrogenase expression/formation protein HypC
MCLAIPGKIVEVGENYFVVDYESEKREVNFSMVEVAVGDYVIVKAGVIIAKVNKETAEGFIQDLKNAGEDG